MRNYDDDDRAMFDAQLRRWATAVALLRERYGRRRGRVSEVPDAWHDRVSLPRI